MESVDIAEIQSSLRTLLREMKGEEAEKLLIDLPDDELAQLWQKGVIEGKSVEILIFMWTRLNYIFQTPSYLNLTKQPGETMLTLPHLMGGFQYLNLTSCLDLHDNSLPALQRMAQLKYLVLKGCSGLSSNAMSSLTKSGTNFVVFSEMYHLDLSDDLTCDMTYHFLVASMPSLRVLKLDRTKTTGKHIELIAGGFKRLVDLSLVGCASVAYEHVMPLLKLKQLQSLDVNGTRVNPSQQKALVEAFAKLVHVSSVSVGMRLPIRIQLKDAQATAYVPGEVAPIEYPERPISHADLLNALLACESAARHFTQRSRNATQVMPHIPWLKSLQFNRNRPSPTPTPAQSDSSPSPWNHMATTPQSPPHHSRKTRNPRPSFEFSMPIDEDMPLGKLLSAIDDESETLQAHSSAIPSSSASPSFPNTGITSAFNALIARTTKEMKEMRAQETSSSEIEKPQTAAAVAQKGAFEKKTATKKAGTQLPIHVQVPIATYESNTSGGAADEVVAQLSVSEIPSRRTKALASVQSPSPTKPAAAAPPPPPLSPVAYPPPTATATAVVIAPVSATPKASAAPKKSAVASPPAKSVSSPPKRQPTAATPVTKPSAAPWPIRNSSSEKSTTLAATTSVSSNGAITVVATSPNAKKSVTFVPPVTQSISPNKPKETVAPTTSETEEPSYPRLAANRTPRRVAKQASTSETTNALEDRAPKRRVRHRRDYDEDEEYEELLPQAKTTKAKSAESAVAGDDTQMQVEEGIESSEDEISDSAEGYSTDEEVEEPDQGELPLDEQHPKPKKKATTTTTKKKKKSFRTHWPKIAVYYPMARQKEPSSRVPTTLSSMAQVAYKFTKSSSKEDHPIPQTRTVVVVAKKASPSSPAVNAGSSSSAPQRAVRSPPQRTVITSPPTSNPKRPIHGPPRGDLSRKEPGHNQQREVEQQEQLQEESLEILSYVPPTMLDTTEYSLPYKPSRYGGWAKMEESSAPNESDDRTVSSVGEAETTTIKMRKRRSSTEIEGTFDATSPPSKKKINASVVEEMEIRSFPAELTSSDSVTFHNPFALRFQEREAKQDRKSRKSDPHSKRAFAVAAPSSFGQFMYFSVNMRSPEKNRK